MARADGFTLTEVLVATAVFSLGAMALLNVVGEAQRAQGVTGERALARIVAENQLIEAMAQLDAPAQGEVAGEEVQLDRSWRWRRTVSATPQAGLVRIDVEVTTDASDQVLASASSFRPAR